MRPRRLQKCKLTVLVVGVTFLDKHIDYFQVSFHGKYNDKECGMSFIAGEEDTGMWK